MTFQQLEIPEHEADFVRQCVDRGRYKDASEVVNAALRLLEQHEEEDRRKRETLRGEVQKGLDDFENGRFIDVNGPKEFAAFFDDISREADQILKSERIDVSPPEVQ